MTRKLNAVELFGVWSFNCTFDGFKRLYSAFGFGKESEGYVLEKWRKFRDNPVSWYMDLDESSRDTWYAIHVSRSKELPPL